MSSELSQFLADCDHLPVSRCSLSTGKPVPHWAITRGLPVLTRMNNFRVRLLFGCDGLELDVSRFRYRQLSSRSTGDPTCPLCLSGREDFMHFVTQCSALLSARDRLLADFRNYCTENPPPSVTSFLAHEFAIRPVPRWHAFPSIPYPSV